jgi:hypothetical protein
VGNTGGKPLPRWESRGWHFGICPKKGFDERLLIGLEITAVFNMAEHDETGADASK